MGRLPADRLEHGGLVDHIGPPEAGRVASGHGRRDDVELDP